MKTASTSTATQSAAQHVGASINGAKPTPTGGEATAPLAASNIVFDQVRPARVGNSGFGILTGVFVDAATPGGPLYTDAVAVIAGHFLPSPPPRITYVANALLGANTYTFIAVGRNV